MALSDRIALLKDGGLEQVASPREIYARPTTSYTAEFIGQTNLLRATIKDGVAACGSLQWPSSQSAGAALFSVRPEAIHLSTDAPVPSGAVLFRAVVKEQTFSGSSEHLELEFAGQSMRARIPARGPLSGEQEFWFSPADAVPVRS
jgi:ABC-type Fe3+/spermidine/putrescine transport system ATPase subunit